MEYNFIKAYKLEAGDTVVVPKSEWEVIQHHALYVGCDPNGHRYMCENVIGKGVKLTRLKDFLNGTNKVSSIKKFSGTPRERYTVIQNALAKLGRPYNLLSYNCEHFVNDVLTKKPASAQVNLALGWAAVIGMAWAIFKD
jgi:hypothetical protein